MGKPNFDVVPRQCAGSRVAPHPQLSAKHQTYVGAYPPYSPNLTPADFFLFPKLKSTLKGRHFQTIEEIQENAIRELRAITERAFQEAYQQGKKRGDGVLPVEGTALNGTVLEML